MTTKLTLTIEEDVIKVAKKYAQKKGRSLSDLVENYLRTLATKEHPAEAVSPRTKRLVGAVQLPNDFDYKKALEDDLTKEYGK